MRALVTGAGGFVGPHLVRHLDEQQDEIVALDLSNGPDLIDGEGWTTALGGYRPDVVYHLAGWSDVGGSWRQPARTFTINAQGTLNVLEASVRAGVHRVVLVSSADVYGLVSPSDLPITESHPAQPRSPYGVSKQAAEALGLQYHRGRGLEVVIVRPFNHIGPGQGPNFAAPAFAAQIAEAELAGGGSIRHGDLSPKRDMTDVNDVVRAYRLLAHKGSPGEIYNVCSGQAVSMQELLDAMIAQAKVPISTSIDPDRLRPVELPVLCGSYAKLTDATGWHPERELSQTVSEVLNTARSTAQSGHESHPPGKEHQ